MKTTYCVYMHTFPNGKRYIGQTSQKPEHRFNNGEGYKGCKYVYSDITKYGWDNVEHTILVDGLDSAGADYYEKYYISLYQTNHKEHGYNLRTGGTAGYEYTDDVKAVMSERQKGRKLSEETKRRMSESRKRYYSTHEVSEETREKLRRPNKGHYKKGERKPLTDETKRKISEALTGKQGKPLTEEQKNHLSEVFKGRKMTPNMLKATEPYRFKNGHAVTAHTIERLKETNSRRVVMLDDDMNIIREFASIGEASAYIGCTRNAVCNCVRGRTKKTGGYIWRYADVI